MKNETLRGLIGLGVFIVLCYFGCKSCNKGLNKAQAEMEQLKIDNPDEWRRRKIAALVDPDGSIDEAEHYAAQLLKDPKSFEHIMTDYIDNKENLMVAVHFRGVNSYGAKVRHAVAMIIDYDGNLIEIVRQEQPQTYELSN